jgi:TolA-binding protein
VPESIRNAIVVAFIAVLVAMVCVGLLLWRGRPAAPPRSGRGLPLLMTDRDGGVTEMSDKLRQMERRVGETQALSQQLMEELKAANEERSQLTTRLMSLEKEVRTLRRRVQESELRAATPAAAVKPPQQPKSTTTPPTGPSTIAPSTTAPATGEPATTPPP